MHPLEPRRAVARLKNGYKVHALVVDDIPENRDVLFTMLSQIGCEVRAAENGRQALASVETHRPDIIFLDVRLEFRPYSTTFQLASGLYWAMEAPRAAVLGPRSFW